MIIPLPEHVWRRLVWGVLVIACLCFVLLGIAESGARGSSLSNIPNAPLPFPRHQVFGLDLQGYSSSEALQWLQAAGPGTFSLTMIPVDPDIVTALSQPNSETAALAAMDTLVDAASASPLAVCLTRPPGSGGGLGVAQAAIGALTERYPNTIAYVSACNYEHERGWQKDIAQATLNADLLGIDTSSALIPLASGAPVDVIRLPGANRVDPDMTVSGGLPGGYSLLSLDCTEPVSSTTTHAAAMLLRDRASVGLILTRPQPGVDPSAFAASIRGIVLTGNPLPEGFSSVTAPGVTMQGDWSRTTVGTVQYARTTASGAALAIDFIGTEVFVQALLSPDGGEISAWLDPDPGHPDAPPDSTIDLQAAQASDTAELVMQGLPAAKHRLVLLASSEEGKSVTIAGFVVTGHPTPKWPARLASMALLAIAIVALTERCLTAIMSIRLQSSRPRLTRGPGHPRVFTRSR